MYICVLFVLLLRISCVFFFLISSHAEWKFAIEIIISKEWREVVGHIMCHCVSCYNYYYDSTQSDLFYFVFFLLYFVISIKFNKHTNSSGFLIHSLQSCSILNIYFIYSYWKLKKQQHKWNYCDWTCVYRGDLLLSALCYLLMNLGW